MIKEIKCKIDDKIGICIENKKGEFSYYNITITKEMLEGAGLDDWFLRETSGFEERK